MSPWVKVVKFRSACSRLPKQSVIKTGIAMRSLTRPLDQILRESQPFVLVFSRTFPWEVLYQSSELDHLRSIEESSSSERLVGQYRPIES
jgi:hypothetical protein